MSVLRGRPGQHHLQPAGTGHTEQGTASKTRNGHTTHTAKRR
jgi:hypothetical protein